MPEPKDYTWWRESIEGKRPPMLEDVPEVGFYRRRLVRNGPWVPAAIWWAGERGEDGELIEDEQLFCTVGKIYKDPREEWTRLASNPITEEEYYRLLGGSNEDEGEDRQPADLNTSKPVF
jgi:hypothetical protein